MSLRKILVQYLGSCLRLPELERDVTLIKTEDGKQYVEVVRCRDCKYVSRDEGKTWCECYRLGAYREFYVEPDGFCAWGERC